MYDVAARLDPDGYFTLARATYREMVAAGITTVGEFHYLHHRPDGSAYDDPNAMGSALLAAAREAGLRIALLDTCYLSSGFGAPVAGVQVRYSDGDAAAWTQRATQVTSGASIHSVRAVPRGQLAQFRGRQPLHVHLSEQVAENEACLAAYGVTPTRLLYDEGLLGPATTVVHATHLTSDDTSHDIELLALWTAMTWGGWRPGCGRTSRSSTPQPRAPGLPPRRTPRRRDLDRRSPGVSRESREDEPGRRPPV